MPTTIDKGEEVVRTLTGALPAAGGLFAYHFMQNALLAGALVAVVAGCLGYFMVLRGQSFAGHALAQVGFAGAAGAVAAGISPLLGLLLFEPVAALAMGVLAGRHGAARREGDIGTGTVLAFSLGLGLLFIRLSGANTTAVYAILFGTVLGIDDRDLLATALTTLLALAVLAVAGRPLLFASVDPDVAAARGVPVRALDVLFLLLLAIAVAQAVQVVGALLAFALLVTPAAAARLLTASPGRAIVLSVLLALACTWLGIAIAYFTPYPTGFFITSLAFVIYLLARLCGRGAGRPGSPTPHPGSVGTSDTAAASPRRPVVGDGAS